MFVDCCEDSHARRREKSTEREMRKCFWALSWLKGRIWEIYDTFVLQSENIQGKSFRIISVSVFSCSALFWSACMHSAQMDIFWNCCVTSTKATKFHLCSWRSLYSPKKGTVAHTLISLTHLLTLNGIC